MSIKQYPKHQFVFELNNNEIRYFMDMIPSFSGYLKHMRVKVLRKGSNPVIGKSKVIVESVLNNQSIYESSWVNYDDITEPITADFWHSFVRFDFDYVPLIADGTYRISLYQEQYSRTDQNNFAYCLDYNFPINSTSEVNHPFNNFRLAAEFFLTKDYYEFD